MITIRGREFDVTPEPADFWGWVAAGHYDGEWALLEKFVKPEDTFIDLGAWVGSHSLFASTIAKHVYAVEPDPVAFPILSRNVAGRNITVCQAAITDYNGIIELGSGFLGASTTRANRHEGAGIGPWVEGQTFSVECGTLRKLIERIVTPCPMFIKMDVEGSEEQILSDLSFFEEHRPNLYLELHPFWWKREEAMWERLYELSKLYPHAYNIRLQEIDFKSESPRQVVFTK